MCATWWEKDKGWQDWTAAGQHDFTALNVVALAPRKDHIDLFAVGDDGKVYTTFWEPKKK